jgi:hypothetical protein
MAEEGQVSFQCAGEATLLVRFSGRWRLRGGLPSASLIFGREIADVIRAIGGTRQPLVNDSR